MQLLDAALEYASRGWKVFPIFGAKENQCLCGDRFCHSPGKHPIGKLTGNWRESATDAEADIKRWWGMVPDANIGVACGSPSGFWVLDMDRRADPKTGMALVDGIEELVKLQMKFGNGQEIYTMKSVTGGGGLHFFFAYDELAPVGCGKFAEGIDFKGDGGYVLLPPSRHASGGSYNWL